MKKELYFAPATKILSVNMAGSILAGSEMTVTPDLAEEDYSDIWGY